MQEPESSEESPSRQRAHSEINDLGSFWENVVIAAIIGVIVVTFLDELSVIYHWSIDTGHKLLVIGFFFDLFFTIEFIVRMVVNGRQGAAKHYFLHQRGWVDFASSVPLLFLNSGPHLLFILFPEMMGSDIGIGGFFNTIKVLKAIRVTRILRLLRLVKILGKIHNTDSHMANRHISVISTTAIMSIIVTYTAFSVVGYLDQKKSTTYQTSFYSALINNIPAMKNELYAESGKAKTEKEKKRDRIRFERKMFRKLLAGLDRDNSKVMQVYHKDKLLISNYTEDELKRAFLYDPRRPVHRRLAADANVLVVKVNDYRVYLNNSEIYEQVIRVQLIILVCILVIILAFMTLYTKHFVQTISDVVHVMRRGIEDDTASLEVPVNPAFAEDEMFILADLYNQHCLPPKSRQRDGDSRTNTGGLAPDGSMAG